MRIATLFFILLFMSSSWAKVNQTQSEICFSLLGINQKDILENKVFDGINFYKTNKLYAACYKKKGEKNTLEVVAFLKKNNTLVISNFSSAKSKTFMNTIKYSEYVALAKSKNLNKQEKLRKENYRMSSALVLNIFDQKLYKEKIDPHLFINGEKSKSQVITLDDICRQLVGFKNSDIQKTVAGDVADQSYFYSLNHYYVGCKRGKNKSINVVMIDKKKNDIILKQYDSAKSKNPKTRTFTYSDYLQSLKKANLTESERKEQQVFVLLSETVLSKLNKALYARSFAIDGLKSQKTQNQITPAKQSTKTAALTKKSRISTKDVSTNRGVNSGSSVISASQPVVKDSRVSKKNNKGANIENACLDVLGVRSENLKTYINGHDKKEFNIYYGTNNSYVACRKSKKDPKLIQVAVVSKKTYDLAVVSYDRVAEENKGVKLYKYQDYVDGVKKGNLKPEEQEEQRVFNAVTKSILTEVAPDVYKKDFDPQTLKKSNKLETKSNKGQKSPVKSGTANKTKNSKVKKAPAKSSKASKTKNQAAKKSRIKASSASKAKSRGKYDSETKHHVKDFVPDYLLQDLPPKLRNK